MTAPDPALAVAVLDLVGLGNGARVDRSILLRLLAAEEPLTRAAAAAALARCAPLELPASVFRDPFPAVSISALVELQRTPVPVRVRFAEQHSAELLRLTAAADPQLYRLARNLLALTDSPAVQHQLIELLDAATTAERARYLTVALERLPRDLEPLLDAVERWQTIDPEIEWRARLLRAARYDRPLEPDIIRAALELACGPPNPEIPPAERDAARALLGRSRRTLGDPLIAAIAELTDPDTFRQGVELAASLFPAHEFDHINTLLRLVAPDTERQRALVDRLARFPQPATAELLWELTRNTTGASSLRTAIVETARRLPRSAPRRRTLLAALNTPGDESRLRAFEQLARDGASESLEPLIDALLREPSAAVRSRMLPLFAETFGGTASERTLRLLSDMLDRDVASDRRAALAAMPFVALGDSAEAIAQFLVQRFGDTEVDRLMIVLAQIGGDFVERHLAGLAERWHATPPEPGALYSLLLLHCGRLTGEPTRAALVTALDSDDERARGRAYEALLERTDPATLERALDVLPTLHAAVRSDLILRWARVARHPLFPETVSRALAHFSDDDTRAALIELGAATAPETVLVAVQQIFASDDTEQSETLLLTTLTRLGGTRAEAILELVRPLVDRVLEVDPVNWGNIRERDRARARTALGVLVEANPTAAVDRIARYLLREPVSEIPQRLARRVGGGTPATNSDPALVAALARVPPTEAIAALDRALQEIRPFDSLFDERFWSRCATDVRRADGDPRLTRWFLDRVLTGWPAGTPQDFEALTRGTPMASAIRRRDPAGVDWTALPLARLRATWMAARPSPGLIDETLGRRRPLQGSSPERTLTVLETLAADADPARRRAEREAGDDARLLLSLATGVERDRTQFLLRRARELSPDDPVVLIRFAEWLESSGESEGALALYTEARRDAVAASRAPPARALLREAALREALGDDLELARSLLHGALRLDPELATVVRAEASLAGLRAWLTDGRR